jgi:spermidine/putrescine transport system ATP-binding protein
MAGEIRLEELCKKFDDFVAVDGIDIDMPPGEFFTLLGPSGCGKTTTLRMIAGFERPTSGRILLDGSDVAKNVAFGLKYHKVGKEERAQRVGEALELVSMSEFAQRKSDQLSGGQQQRVALARALVLRPRVLLLDEPLGALDAQLRKNLQVELKALQAELGITFIFVTHDQSEALTMSDRIAVMNRGQVEQAAGPKEIYEEPETVFVADFLGVSNLLSANAVGHDGSACTVQVGDRTLRARQGATDARGEVKVMIRPERIIIEPHSNTGEERMPGMVERSVFLGGSYEVHVRVLGGEVLKAMVPNDGSVSAVALEPGAAVCLHLPPEALRVLRDTEPAEPPDEDEADESYTATVN